MLGTSACVHSPMTDEIAHFAAGLGHLRYSDFELYNVNPPLARVVGILPVHMAMPWDEETFGKVYSEDGSSQDAKGVVVSHRKEFSIGHELLHSIGPSYFFWMMIARWACIPFSCIGALVCFFWASDLYGRNAGWVALVLWCTSPLVLAFGGALTPDVPSGAMGLLALYRFWKWAREGSFANAYLAGLAIGLAELTKSTWILLHPALFLVTVVLCFRRLKWGIGFRYLGSNNSTQAGSLYHIWQGGFILVLAWVVLLAGYGFTDQFKPLGKFDFSSPQLQVREYSESGELVGVTSNRFRDTWMGAIPVPLPTEFVRGVDTQESATAAQTIVGYLCGELRMGGWWYYYLFVLLVKCTVGEIGLFLVATVGWSWSLFCRGQVDGGQVGESLLVSELSVSERRSYMRSPMLDFVLILGPVILFMILLGYHTGLNRHARYMLQFLPLCFVWSSQAVTFFPNRIRLRSGTIFLVAFGSFSSLLAFPHSLSYFNEFVGGPSQGYRYLSGTNIDWGHNVFYLRDELIRRGWDSVGMSLWTRYDLKLAGIEAEITKIPKRRYSDTDIDETLHYESKILKPGRYALSICNVQGTMGVSSNIKKGEPIDNGYMFFQEFQPVGHVGYSIWLYDLSEEDILRSKSWGEIYRRSLSNCTLDK